MKFIFKASLANDVWNWQVVANHKGSYGYNWRSDWPRDLTLKDARDNKKLRAYLNRNYYRKQAVQKYAVWMQAEIVPMLVDNIVFDITGHRIPFKEVVVTITTYARCPYDPEKGGFFIKYHTGPQWVYRTAIHECMHFVVHKYYWNQMTDAGLSNEQAHDIKEALTVLFEPIFIKVFGGPEEGYPNHQNLRKDIARIAKTTKDFDEIMAKTIKLFQRKYFEKVS